MLAAWHFAHELGHIYHRHHKKYFRHWNPKLKRMISPTKQDLVMISLKFYSPIDDIDSQTRVSILTSKIILTTSSSSVIKPSFLNLLEI